MTSVVKVVFPMDGLFLTLGKITPPFLAVSLPLDSLTVMVSFTETTSFTGWPSLGKARFSLAEESLLEAVVGSLVVVTGSFRVVVVVEVVVVGDDEDVVVGTPRILQVFIFC